MSAGPGHGGAGGGGPDPGRHGGRDGGHDGGGLDPAGAPPPGPQLAAALAELRPVRTRVPARAVALLLGASAAMVAAGVGAAGLREDLGALPAMWIAGVAVAWVAGLLVSVLAATWPRPGQVLPDPARAARVALLVAGGLMLLSLLASVEGPAGASAADPAHFGHLWWHCTKFSLKTLLPLLVVGGLVLRRLFPMGGVRIGAALGAAGGAAGAGALHVALAHAGGVAIGALLGMLALPRALRG
jgi:hypothetical protein